MTMTLVDSVEEMTADWFTTALRAGGTIDASTTVTAAAPELFGTGQVGLVVRSTLEVTGPSAVTAPSSVIVKIASPDPASRGLALAIGAYEGEVRFYGRLADAPGLRVPACHAAGFDAATGRVTLVLEDLTDGWTVGDAVAGGTVEQAGAAFDQLAAVHASRWGLAGDDLAWLRDPARTQVLFDGVPAAVPAFLARFGERLDDGLLSLVSRLGPEAAAYPAAWQDPLVVAHGDFRLDNVLFRAGPDGLEAALIDWQSVRAAPAGVDLAMWLGSCLSPDDRREHLDALLERYRAALVAHGVAGVTTDDVRQSLRVGALYPFLLGVGASMMMQQSERGDAMFAAMVTLSGSLVADLDAAEVLR